MFRCTIHMKALLILFFLFSGSKSFSQEEFDTLVGPPVVADEETSSTSYYESNFDSFSIHLPTVRARKIQDSTLRNLQNHKDYWYANQVFSKKKAIRQEEPDSSWMDTLIWFIIIGGFVAVLVWYLASSNI